MKETNFSSRQAFWKALIRDMQASSLSEDEFAKAKGVSKSSLVRWAKRLSEAPATATTKRRVRKERKNFLIIEPGEAEPRLRVDAVKIAFPSGATIHMMERPEPEWLSLMMKLIS